MEEYQTKSLALIMRSVASSLEDHYLHNNVNSVKQIVAMDAFEHLRDQVPEEKLEKINEYVSDLMKDISKEKYNKHINEVLILVAMDVKGLITELLTEAEAKEFYEFGSSSTGQKVFRNMDLFRAAVQKGRHVILGEVVAAWSVPETAHKIEEYIRKVEES